MNSPSAHEVTCPLCGGSGAVPALRIALIKLAVSRHFGISVTQLVSMSQDKATVRARHIGMYLAREMLGRSYQEIAGAFGRTDHTTVRHAVRKIGTASNDVASDIQSLVKILDVSGSHARPE